MITLLLVLLPVLVIPFVVRLIWPREITWLEMGATLVIGVAISAGVYAAGLYGETADTEIWSGQILQKQRVHDSYVESYQCNCVTTRDSNGNSNTTCQTCFRDHYTVEWSCNTSIGKFRYKSLDELDSSVYRTPDPQNYTMAKVGDPVSKAVGFTNYVKAVPDSLFHAHNIQKFEKMLPEYPDDIYDIYKINRALSVGVPVPDIAQWNQDIALTLRQLGPGKQANIIVVFANTADQSYVQALEGKWIGGKKNDIIVVMGVTQYPKIDFVTISSWTDKQIFKVELRNAIMEIGQVDRPKIMAAITEHTNKSFVRKQMKDFEYLKAQIEPPTWVLTLAVILGIIASLGSTYYFYNNDPFGNTSYRRGFRF